MKLSMEKRLHRDQSGLASIVIAILIIIVLSTMVLGFLQIIRRESRRSLDRQLSTQAYYAAESGVNDAVKAIQQEGFTGDKSKCGTSEIGLTAALTGTANQLSSSNVQYSCLLINQTPGDLEYSNVTTNHSKAFPVQSGAASISSIAFGWETHNVSQTTPSYITAAPTGDKDFTTATSWGTKTGILRIDVLPFTSASMTRAQAITNARSYFLYPSTAASAGVVSYADPSGTITGGNCTIPGGPTTRRCNVKLSNLPAGTTKVFVRILALYNPIDVTVEAYDGSLTPTVLKLDGAQTLVDSTGKAADVYRRIQVRVPQADVDIPDFALASMETLCKKFTVNPTPVYAIVDGSTDAACYPSNW